MSVGLLSFTNKNFYIKIIKNVIGLSDYRLGL